jgi:hypothetical protein
MKTVVEKNPRLKEVTGGPFLPPPICRSEDGE